MAIDFKEVLKISVKNSLFYVLLTTFITKLFYVIFKVKEHGDSTMIDAIFNQEYDIIIFSLFLVLAFKSYRKTENAVFNGILVVTLFYVLLSYFVGWIVDFIFYRIHILINGPQDISTGGFLGAMSFSPYHLNDLSLVQYFITGPYFAIMELFSTGNILWLFNLISPPSFFIAAIVIYFMSLYLLFKKENQTNYYALIPVLNNLTLLKITKKPLWWIVPLCIPFVRLVPKLLINKIIAGKYNKTKGFAYGMTFVPWFFMVK